jgi:hypothetical protein
MKLVTYVAGDQKPRVGVLEIGGIVDVGFDGDMIAFIEAGAPLGKRTPVGHARLLAPLRSRSMRDFLTKAGDVVEMEIEGIGILRNRIGKKGA